MKKLRQIIAITIIYPIAYLMHVYAIMFDKEYRQVNRHSVEV